MPGRPACVEGVQVAVGRSAFAAARHERGLAQGVAPAQPRQAQRQVDQRGIARGIAAGIQPADALARAAAQDHGMADRGGQLGMQRRQRRAGLGGAVEIVRRR